MSGEKGRDGMSGMPGNPGLDGAKGKFLSFKLTLQSNNVLLSKCGLMGVVQYCLENSSRCNGWSYLFKLVGHCKLPLIVSKIGSQLALVYLRTLFIMCPHSPILIKCCCVKLFKTK